MLYTQETATIHSRGVWHYLIDTPIGHIHVVEYETPTREITRFLIDSDNDKAERKFASICKGILNYKL